MTSPTSADISPMQAAAGALRKHWGHADFRSGQREAVEAVLRGEDVLAVLPTGGGKSICYQVPAIVRGGLTVVVSPLIALMQDQVAGLRARRVPTTFINSQLSFGEIEQRWVDVEHGLYRLLYVAPERFATETFRQRAGRLDVRLLAVDEAHCISEWGPDFRPAYRRLAEAAELMGRPPIVAVTATATPEVRRDILAQLGLNEPRVVVSGFNRPNVIPSVFQTSAKQEKLLEVLNAVPGTAIVYVSTRAAAESTAERLRLAGVEARPYHAGLPAAERIVAQERWQSGETRVITATNAFGMGIDKPDVRSVIHLDLPPSIEAYYQEAGRAGRDGRSSHAVLLFAESDEVSAKSFLADARPEREAVQAVYDTACSIAQIAVGSEREAPFLLDVEQVAAIAGLSPMSVRAAVDVLAREGVWEEMRVVAGRLLIRVSEPAATIRKLMEGHANRALSSFVADLLREVPGEAFHEWAELDAGRLAKRVGIPTVRVLRGLDFLAQRELLAYLPPGDGVRIRLRGHRSRFVQIDGAALENSRRRAERRLDVMLRYARGLGCRRQFLLSYFGEAAPTRCGSCDVCLGRHRPPVITPEDESYLRRILAHVQSGEASSEWLAEAGLPAHRVHGLADWLVNEGHIRLDDPLAGTYALTPRGRDALRKKAEVAG